MIYTIKAVIEVDTTAAKVVIKAEDKRIALTPVTRSGPDCYAVINDRPDAQPKTATELLRWLAHNLYGRQQIRRMKAESLAPETTNGK